MRSDMNLEQKNGARGDPGRTYTPPELLRGDLAGTMADYTAESRFFTPDGMLRGSEAIRQILREVVRGVREAGDVVRDAPA